MNVALAKTETGRALSDAFALVRDRLPGAGKVAEARQQAFERLRARRPAAPPDRGLEIHRPARPDARSAAARGAARCGRAQARGRGPEAACDRRCATRLVLVDGVFAPNCPISPASRQGLASARCARCWSRATPRRRRNCSASDDRRHRMVALNSAHDDGRRRDRRRRRCRATQPIHIVHVAAGARRRRCSPARC